MLDLARPLLPFMFLAAGIIADPVVLGVVSLRSNREVYHGHRL